MGQKKRVLAVLDDLFFLVKIQDAAKRVGLEVVFVKTDEQAMMMVADHPDLIVLDLNNKTAHPLELITSLRNSCKTPECRIMAFVSHVETDLQQQAMRLGCDLVLPRSAFSANLPKLLDTYCNYRAPGPAALRVAQA